MGQKRGSETAGRSANTLIYLLYAALALSIIGYIALGSALIGLLSFLLILLLIVVELRTSLRSEGARKTLKDIAIALVAAVVAFWLIPSLLLGTASPINVVASCSMLPKMHRGDLVILHGVANMSAFLSKNHIPVVNVSQSSLSSMLSDMQAQFTEPFAYFDGNRSRISPVISGIVPSGIAFYNLVCIASHPKSEYAGCSVSHAVQMNNLIQYSYSTARLETPAGNASIVYVPSITIGNTTITENYSNPIIVYKTTPQDYFTGDIIHRVFAAIRSGNRYYLLTKGDNNPILDIESVNYPVNSTDVAGYVVVDIPYLGYPSLIIKGKVGSVPGCNQTIVRN